MPYIIKKTPNDTNKTRRAAVPPLQLRHCSGSIAAAPHFAPCSHSASSVAALRFAAPPLQFRRCSGSVAVAPLRRCEHPPKPTHQKPLDFLYNLSQSPPHGAPLRSQNIFAHFVRFGSIVGSSGGGGDGRVYCCNQCSQM